MEPPPYLPGSLVLARQRRWRVVDAQAGTGCVVVRLSPDDGSSRPLSLIAPFDRLQPVQPNTRPRRVHRRAVARACAATLLDTHPWAGTPTALRSNIRILPFQLEPALAVLLGECTRVLLADEVGLGKTIQAGLVINELTARHEAERVLVVTPAGLRDQWERELHERFNLTVRRVDAAWLTEAGRVLPPWIDPWSLPGISLVSIDLIKRPEVLGQLTHTVWDLVVIDEAHHAAQPSERREAAAALSVRSRYIVLMTATPHGGDSVAFDRLLQLGQIEGETSPIRVFRRDRADAGLAGPPRKARVIRVRSTREERAMIHLLDRYTRRVWRESGRGSDARLAMIVLRKRALSSPWSLARSVERRLAVLGEPAPIDGQLSLSFEDPDGDSIPDDDVSIAELGAPGLADTGAERELLDALLSSAHAAEASGQPGAKLQVLRRALFRCRERVIVFTEYRDTLQHIARYLGAAVPHVCLHGGLLPAARDAAIDAFVRGPARVLLATDAAGEGLNLHQRCRWVIHFELPWSAIRLEQRAGRVDRIGQSRQVHAWSLVAVDTDEERVLMRLDSREAIGEEDVARAIFEGRVWPRRAFRRLAAGRTGSAEARRLTTLAALNRFNAAPPVQPVTTNVRRRGPFARFSGRKVVVYRADLNDASGRRVAGEATGLEAAAPDQATDRRAARVLGRRLRQSAAAYRSFARLAWARDRAVASRVETTAAAAGVQQSLFDRRASQAADRAEAAANDSAGRLLAHGRTLEAAGERLAATCRRVAQIVLR